MEENAATFPQKEFEAVRALEDGDLVAVHGRVRLTPSRPWIALIHIFRFQDNQIIEGVGSRSRSAARLSQ